MFDQTITQKLGKSDALVVHETEPFNAGPRLTDLNDSAITPNSHFFVRSHGDIPTIDPDSFRLTIDGLVSAPLTLNLADLAPLPRHTITATLQCAGNRRQDLIEVAPIPKELPWGAEAISTATWSGVRLHDVLKLAKIDLAAQHVAFEGFDQTERHGKTFGFGGSIPLAKALHPDTILADTMNDAPLPAVHGAPLRVIAPGYIGARSVKWLKRITLQAEPSSNYFQAVAYRLFPPQVNHENVDWDTGLMLGELSLNAVICSHTDGAELTAGKHTIAGYAMAGGERSIARVDVSADGGATWQTAQLISPAQAWTWQLWQIELELNHGDHELVVRMVDSSANTQPASAEPIWNFKGYMSNAWHRVRIQVQ